MKILIITNELLITCGVSKHLLYFLTEVKKKDGFEFTILCGGGDAVDDYKKFCKEVIVHPEIKHEKRSIYGFIKIILFLFKLNFKNKYDIFHSHNHYAANIAKVVANISKIKTVQSIHEIIEPIGRLNHYPAEYFIVVNEHIYNFLINHYDKQPQYIKIIRSGIPSPTHLIKPITEKLKVISAGRLIPEKGFSTFIEAVSKINREIQNNVEFMIAGKGEYKYELMKHAEKFNSRIIFLGEIKDLISYLRVTHIFVLASRAEGFPISLIEAALTRNLIISSNFIGYNSILKDEINSLIFNIDSSDELSAKLEYAIKNYLDLKPIIERSYNDALVEFNIDKMVNSTIKLYKDISA